MNWLKSLALLVVVVAAALFGALWVNQQEVHLSFFGIWQTPFPLSVFWWMLAAFVIGVIAGILISLWAGLRRRLELRRTKRELTQANAEVNRLRDVTLQG